MTNKPTRTYTASEVREIVELHRDDPDISAEKFSGMEQLADILKHFEGKTDADIEEEFKGLLRSECSKTGA